VEDDENSYQDVSRIFCDNEMDFCLKNNHEVFGWFIDGYKFACNLTSLKFKDFSIELEAGTITDPEAFCPGAISVCSRGQKSAYNYCNFTLLVNYTKKYGFVLDTNTNLEVMYRNYLLSGNKDFLTDAEKKILDLIRVFKFVTPEPEQINIDDLLNCCAPQSEINKIKM
jgi:hypothetical protein